MANLLQEIALEEEHILMTLAALQEAQNRPQNTLIELSAMATFLHNIYSGMENLLKRALRHLGISLPGSASSHQDLLDLVENMTSSPSLCPRNWMPTVASAIFSYTAMALC